MKNLLCAIALTSVVTNGPFLNAAPMGSAFTYQGRLLDGQAPANGAYDFMFVLREQAAPGGIEGSSGAVFKSRLGVTNGLFTAELDYSSFGVMTFGGDAQWLEVAVRSGTNGPFTTLSPRQPITPAVYALFASNAVNATTAINATFATNVADGAINSSKLAPGAVTWSSIANIPAGFADGVDNDTTYSAGAGLTLNGANQFSANFAGTGAANTVAHSDHGHFGAAWSGSSFWTGLSVVNSLGLGAGLYGQQGDGSGQFYLFAPTTGVWGESRDGFGVYGASGASGGAGVYGLGTSTNGYDFGVYGDSRSQNGCGVFGLASATRGTNSGVSGLSLSTAGYGVHGRHGDSPTNYYASGIVAAGVMGVAKSWTGVAGVSDQESGVTGYSSRSSGVAGVTDTGNYGVFGASTAHDGVGGFSQNGSGVYGYSHSGEGVYAYCGSGTAVHAVTSDGNLFEGYQQIPTLPDNRRFYVSKTGEVYADGAFHPGGADFAEMLPGHDALSPGDVLVIGRDGKLAQSTHAYQDNLAGVYATKPGLLGGAHDGADLTGKVPLAVVGVVPVKVTNENGVIEPGDKLTSSSTPGYAMKADRGAEIGTVIGKALQKFESQRGAIEMLVILQ